jgi:ATP-dependent HslUV protease ATP-binding subunit HslU
MDPPRAPRVKGAMSFAIERHTTGQDGTRMTSSVPFEQWTPRQIVAELDQYVIGQRAAKRSVAIALRNRHRRQQVPAELREEILPNNILMIGPTGVGKTEIARRLARLSGAPFIKVEATKFTEVGYVGRDVESIIRDLTEIAVSMVRQELSEKVVGRAEKQVEERLLNLLHPRRRRASSNGEEIGSDDWQMLRAKLRSDLRAGLLDQRMVEIDLTEQHSANFELLSQLGIDAPDLPFAEALEGILPKRKKRRRVTTAEARRLLVQEETRRIIDMDEVIEQSIARVQSSGIVFLDEIDKVCSSGGGKGGPEVSREGVQRDLLPIVEGCSVTTKYGVVRTDHILFIAAGAFHVNRPSDLLPELQGRLPIRVELEELSAADFLRILTEPRNSLVRQYQALLRAEDVDLRFSQDALEEVAAVAYRVNQTTENIGARRLQTILNTLLEDVLFDVPDRAGREVLVDRERVVTRLSGIVQDKDLSSYIL